MSINVDYCYRRYAAMVLRRCRSILKDEDQAADALQETFLRVLRCRDSLSDQSPSSLLYRIATNVCINQLRSDKRSRTRPAGDDIEQLFWQNEHHSEQILSEMVMTQVMDGLPPVSRVVAEAYYRHGHTLEEMALTQKLSISGVRKRLQRATALARRHKALCA